MKRFRSRLGPSMKGFLTLHRAAGKKYVAVEEELRRLDRFAATRPSAGRVVTPELAHAWLSAKPHLQHASQTARASVLRLFCLYLNRTDPKAYVPPRSVFPTRPTERKPHIYSKAELGTLFAAARGLSTRGWWFRPQVTHTMLLLLYATGLRIGEACRLRVRDVDFAADTLMVRDTKFFKTRLVPFSSDLRKNLRSYLDVRQSIVPSDVEAPFFINRRRRQVSPVKFSWFFHGLIQSTGLRGNRAERGPRLHDLRRTFAVHRLIRWYREGADIWAKLPLLATYLGHSDPISTHVYLTATTELLGEASGRFEKSFGSLLVEQEEA